MNIHSRAKIHLEKGSDIYGFIAEINAHDITTRWTVEDFEGNRIIDARSVLGMVYAFTEWDGETYLVNNTDNGIFPAFIDKYRI